MNATRIDRGSTDSTTIYSEGPDLVFERTFDATREQVWKAFTDPELVPRWWGPHGTTATVAEMDVRPGGKWRYISRAADREDVAFYGEYLEVDPPAKVAYTFRWEDPDPEDQETVVTLSLREVGPSTGLTFMQGDFLTERRRALHAAAAECR